MGQETLYVGFGGRQVVVTSDEPKALRVVKRRFEAMLEPCRSHPSATIAVSRSNGEFMLQDDVLDQPKRGSLGFVARELMYSVLSGLVENRQDFLWLHAGAVARDKTATLFVGPSGRGKSTLTTCLYARGWRFLSDDLTPLNLDTGEVMPFPRTPSVRTRQDVLLPNERLPEIPRTVVALDADSLPNQPFPIDSIVFPMYDPETRCRLRRCSAPECATGLIKAGINFTTHGEAAMDRLCGLARRVKAYELLYSDRDAATELLIRSRETDEQS